MAEAVWKRVAAEAELKEGEPIVVEVGTDRILLVRIGGKVHAVNRECPHYQEKLEKGVLFGTEIVCKSHFARFDVTTGRVLSPPACNDLPVYPVKIENAAVWLGASENPKFPRPPANLGSDPRFFVIVGAGAAGNAAAEFLRRRGFAGRIVMLTPEPDRPYDRPNLSKDFITGKAGEDWLPLHGSKFYTAQGIELMTGRRVVSLDAKKKVIGIEGGETLAFDKALIATGGVPRRLAVPGADGPGCHVLRTAADARAIVAAAAVAKNVVVIGAGFIGLEMAGSLREKGLEVTVVAPEPVPLAHVFGDRIGGYMKTLLEGTGVTLLLGKTPKEISGPAGAKTVTLSDGTVVKAGFVVIGLGIQPAVDWLVGTGLVEDGAVPVDEQMRTRAADVFAAGDIAAVPDKEWGRRRVEHWVVAQRQGARAAAVMLGQDPGTPEVDVFWTKLAGASLKSVGNTRGHDQVLYRGSVEEGKFLAGFFRKGKLTAAATLAMPQDLVAVERLLRLGAPPTPAQFQDAGFDLVKAAQAV